MSSMKVDIAVKVYLMPILDCVLKVKVTEYNFYSDLNVLAFDWNTPRVELNEYRPFEEVLSCNSDEKFEYGLTPHECH